MNEEVILLLSELRSQITNTISRIEKENALERKESVSTLMNLPFVSVQDHLGAKESDFLEYLESMSFMKTIRTEIVMGYTSYRRIPTHEWIKYKCGRGWVCHPALIALFEIYDKKPLIMEEWREQLDRQIESDLQHKKEMLLAEFDKSVEPNYKQPLQLCAKEYMHHLLPNIAERFTFMDWLIKRGYIKIQEGVYIPVSPLIEKRKGYFYVCPEMVIAFFLDIE